MKDFRASSGNLCRVSEIREGWVVEWRDPPSAQDQTEFLAWANRTFGPKILAKWGLKL